MTRPVHRIIATGELVFPEGYLPEQIEQVSSEDLDAAELLACKGQCVSMIDRQAERVRQLFLTPGAGQALTYQRKEAEARAWTSGSENALFPFLAAEAAATGVTMEQMVEIVISQANAWGAVGAIIEGLRMGAKMAVRDAETKEAAMSAMQIDWPQP